MGALWVGGCGNEVAIVSPAGVGARGDVDGGDASGHDACSGDDGWRDYQIPVRDVVVDGWSGQEVLFWGVATHAGYRFHAGAETWRKMATAPPIATVMFRVAAVSSGKFFVWDHVDGAAYDWANDSWTTIAPMGGRPFNTTLPTTVVGTPHHLVFVDLAWEPGKPPTWPSATLTGKIYDVERDKWEALPEEAAPMAVSSPVAIWAETELLVWGGVSEAGITNAGARFNPSTRTWRPMTTLNAPTPAMGSAAAWTGRELFVWGGLGNNGQVFDGGLYDPVSDTWRPVTHEGAPRSAGGAAWTGSEVIVTGVKSESHGIYNPTNDSWRPMLPAPGNTPNWSLVQWDGCRVVVANGYEVALFQPASDR